MRWQSVNNTTAGISNELVRLKGGMADEGVALMKSNPKVQLTLFLQPKLRTLAAALARKILYFFANLVFSSSSLHSPTTILKSSLFAGRAFFTIVVAVQWFLAIPNVAEKDTPLLKPSSRG